MIFGTNGLILLVVPNCFGYIHYRRSAKLVCRLDIQYQIIERLPEGALSPPLAVEMMRHLALLKSKVHHQLLHSTKWYTEVTYIVGTLQQHGSVPPGGTSGTA